jgi:hypothetical protein
MSFPEEISEWQVPDYINEGLKWLETEPEENREAIVKKGTQEEG